MPETGTDPSQPVNRRQVLKTVGAAGIGGLLAGCTGGGGGDDETTTAQTTEQTTTQGKTTGKSGGGGKFVLEYVDVDGDRAAEHFQPVIDDLNEKYDASISLDFKEIPYGNMKQQLLTRVGGGNEPDVAAIDQIWLGSFYQSGKLMTFNDVKDQVNFDDYFAGFQQAVVQQGDLVGFPITTDVRGMYWNKDQFEKAGLDPDTPPETWSEYYEMGKQLHNPPKQFGTGVIVAAGIFSVPLFSAGGQFLSDGGSKPGFNNEEGYQAAEFYDKIYNDEDFGPSEPITSGGSFPQEFLKGTYATTPVYGSWMDFFGRNQGMTNEEMLKKFGFSITPHPEGKDPATMNGGFGWAAFETTERPDIVKDFMVQISRKEFNRKIARVTGRIPTRKSLLDADDVWTNILWADTIKGMLEYGHTRPVNNWSTVSEVLSPALERVAYDKAEPKAALDKAAQDLQSKL